LIQIRMAEMNTARIPDGFHSILLPGVYATFKS